jgi:hypothetical protein
MLTCQPLVGRWEKTNRDAQWIRSLHIREVGGRLCVRVHGDTSPGDWGECETDQLYASSPDAREASAFIAHFTLPHHEVTIEANVNLGLLVVAALTRNGGAVGQFTREFFYRGAS